MVLRYICNAVRSVCNKTIEARHSAAHTNNQYNHSKQRPQSVCFPTLPVKHTFSLSWKTFESHSKLATTIFLLLTSHCHGLEPARRETQDHRWSIRAVAWGGANAADKLSLWILLCRCQPLPRATTDHLGGASGQMALRQWLLPTTSSSSMPVQTMMSLPRVEQSLTVSYGSLWVNHTRGNFLIHSIPQAIHRCAYHAKTDCWVSGFCFSFFKVILSPWM